MSNRNDLIPWIRYDSKGIMIPGTLVYRKKKPAGRFKRLVDPNEPVCCQPTTSSTTTVPVVNCIDLGYWGEYTISPDEQNVDLEPVNVVADGECNSYKLLKPNRGGPGINFDYNGYTLKDFALIEKLDGSGTLVWQKLLFVTDPGQTTGNTNFIDPQNLCLGVDGSIYITSRFYVIKLDATGNFVWLVDTQFYGGSVLGENLQILTPTTGRVYFVAQGFDYASTPPEPDYPQFIMEINPATGNVISGKAFYAPVTPGLFSTYATYAGYAHTVDNSGNLICSINASTDLAPNYPTYGGVIKLDPDLNQIWAVMFQPGIGDTTGFNGEIMGISVDANDNVFCVFGDSSAITKLDVSGNIIWSKYITYDTGAGIEPAGLLNVNTDSTGNAYVLTRDTTLPNFGPGPVINILKFDPSGNMQFLESYWYSNLGSTIWTTNYPYCSITSDIKNDVLYINTGNNSFGTDNNLVKLPLTTTGTLSINSYNFDTGTTFISNLPNHLGASYVYGEYTAPVTIPDPYDTYVSNPGFGTVTTPLTF